MNTQEYKAKAKNTIDELFQQVEQLEQRAQNIEGEAKAKAQAKLKELRQQKTVLANKLEQMGQTTGENLDTLREAFSAGVQTFRNTLAK